jgi:hypothetical protein
MRVTALIIAATLASLFGVAAAEKVKTNQETKIYSRPGEQAKVIVKVKSGQNMTLLAQDGRWLKVRVQGRTGFVPRSMVDMPEGDEIVRNTRRRAFVDGRSTRRGFGGESPDDRVGADATGDNAAGGDEEEKAKEKPSKSKDDDKGKRVAMKTSKQKDTDDEEEQPKSTKKKPEKQEKPEKPEKPDKAEKPKPKADKGKADKAEKADKEDKGGGDDEEEELKVTDDDKGDDASSDEARPTAHVSEKAVVYNERDKESGELFVAKPNMMLYPGETKGKWTFVENDDGDGGWIMSSQLDVDTSGGGGDEGGPRKRDINAGAKLGVMIIQQGMRTTGGAATFPDTYNLGTSAAAISLGGGIMYPFGKSGVFGGEATLDYAKTVLGGISVPGSSVQEQISLMTFSLRASAGYDLHKKNGMTVLGRLGYRYQAFLVDSYNVPAKNPANLPQETFAAPTLGAGLMIPHITPKIGLGFTLDTILFGASIAQTRGFQDGTKPDAKAAYVGVLFTYHWKKDMDLLGTYNLDFASYNFGPPSMDPLLNKRMHTGTDVTRTDIFHMVTFGIAKGF